MNKIKISIRLFVITIGLLLFIQLPVFAATGKSTGSCVRIRKAPSTDSEVLEVLATDDEVQILGKEGDWYKITAKGFTGYVSQSFISTTDTISETDKKSEENNAQNNNQTSETTKNETKTENNQTENNQVDANGQKTSEENKPDTSTNKKYKITENTSVNILPVITSEYIGEVKKDEEVTLIINAGLWVYVESNNINGWIRIDKLSTENVNVDTTENNTQKQEDKKDENKQENAQENNKQEENNNAKITNYNSPKTMYVKSAAVNVRSQANINSDVVDSLGINAEVSVVGEEDNWYKIQVNGKNGYIRNDLLSNQKTEVTSRANTVERTANAETNNNTQVTVTQPGTTEQQQETTSQAPVSSSGVTGNDIASYAQQFVGCRYVYGAAGPSSFDCSGLTMYVYNHFGYSLSHSSKVQATQGRAVTGDLQPGDILVFSNDGKTVGHVGIYIGNDKFVHASDSSTGVIISNLSDRWNISKYWGARRIL